jgi:SM-20-related protein
MNIEEHTLDKIADALVERGYLVLDNFLPEALLQDLLTSMNNLPESAFKAAGIGRETDFVVQENIRSDKIHWLEADTPTTTLFLHCMDSVAAGLNRRLFLGLCDYESHYAHYPAGASYKKHLDTFIEKNDVSHTANNPLQNTSFQRVLSTVLYLNKNWPKNVGGELILYSETGTQVLEKILPQLGRIVIFLSEKFPHEVLAANCERKSIAGWFRAKH